MKSSRTLRAAAMVVMLMGLSALCAGPVLARSDGPSAEVPLRFVALGGRADTATVRPVP